MGTSNIKFDIIIFGGGIAGLWLLNRARALGYSALLLETQTLASGQSICAQGIIHGGTKYAIKQKLSPVARAIANMPKLWRDCLAGQGEIDLSQVAVLAERQHLWVPNTLGGKFVGFLTSKAMQSRVSKLALEQYPAAFKTANFNGEVYALDEPVLDTASLIRTLAQPHQTAIRHCPLPGKIKFQQTGEQIQALQIELGSHTLNLEAQRYILTAGAGNQALLEQLGKEAPKMQRRPLHMLMLKDMPYPLFAHAVDMQFKPQITITSHTAADGDIVWYIGGDLSVNGVQLSPEQLFASAQQTLHDLLPDISLANIRWRSFHIDRAEPLQSHQGLPAEPSTTESGNAITAWPVKLAFTPLLVQHILQQLKQADIQPLHPQPDLPADWPMPGITPLPWLEPTPWNTAH